LTVSAEPLDALLAQVTSENVHGEIDTGPSVGAEAWGAQPDDPGMEFTQSPCTRTMDATPSFQA
jgi:hypothetical protein